MCRVSQWLDGLCALGRAGEPAALVTVLATRGSAPREPGAKMTVGGADIHGTIGGGQLEHAAIESARLLLEQGQDTGINEVERHELSPTLGQCCGGVAWLLIERLPAHPPPDWIARLTAAREARVPAYLVTAVGGGDKHVLTDADDPAGRAVAPEVAPLVARAAASGEPVWTGDPGGWFVEPLPPVDMNIVLFGAGHVGRALVGVLAALPCELTWVDSRAAQFPRERAAGIRTITTREPESVVDQCPSGAFYLVMSHSHPLDLAICERILARGDFTYCGLIGSASKRRHFERRLRLNGVTESALNRLTCPIGVAGISGKRPAEIAVAVAAEVLQVGEAAVAARARDASKTG